MRASQITKYAEKKMREIEDEFPPSRCSLDDYRLVLIAVGEEIAERVAQLKEELGL